MKKILFGLCLLTFSWSVFFETSHLVQANGLNDILLKTGISKSEQEVPIPKIETKQYAEEKLSHIIFSSIQLLLIMSGIIGVLLITWGGFRYATSFGEKEVIDASKKIIIGAITGLIVVIISYAILTNIIHFIEIAE